MRLKLKSYGIAVIILFLVSCGGGGGSSRTIGQPLTIQPPQDVTAQPGSQSVTITWSSVNGASSYNIYYSNTPGVTKTTGTKISSVSSPYIHKGLQVGTYYYVVTAVDSGDESAESLEVSAPVNPVVFVTSVSGSGDLGSWADAAGKTGLAAGDAICQARAQAAGLTGTFVAWLSDDNDDAYCRVHGLLGKKSNNCNQTTLPATAGPWVRTDGFPFSDTIDNLTSTGQVFVPLRVDEYGSKTTMPFFTGTREDGTLNIAGPCSNWTLNSNTHVSTGLPFYTTHGWTGGSIVVSLCSQTRALLCFQTGQGPGLHDFSSPGKKVFVTSVLGTGDLGSWTDAAGKTGLAAGDAICQARAQAAGLTGTFVAWLSDDNTNAIDRLTSDGPWVRLDGVIVARSKADLTDGEIFTSINLTETGQYFGNQAAWTGTSSDGTKDITHNCNNWTSSTSIDTAAIGGVISASGEWSSESYYINCDFSGHLYCFEN